MSLTKKHHHAFSFLSTHKCVAKDRERNRLVTIPCPSSKVPISLLDLRKHHVSTSTVHVPKVAELQVFGHAPAVDRSVFKLLLYVRWYVLSLFPLGWIETRLRSMHISLVKRSSLRPVMGHQKSFAASINPVLTAPKLSIKIAAGVSLAFRGRPISDFADFLQIF